MEFFILGLLSYLRRHLAFILVVFFVVLGYAWISNADIARLHPQTCVGEWENSSNATGEADGKSARSMGKNNQITCGEFKGNIPPDGTLKNVSLHLALSFEEHVSHASSTSLGFLSSTLDGETWEEIGSISYTSLQDAHFPLSLENWDDFAVIQVKLAAESGASLLLDALWLEVLYEDPASQGIFGPPVNVAELPRITVDAESFFSSLYENFRADEEPLFEILLKKEGHPLTELLSETPSASSSSDLLPIQKLPVDDEIISSSTPSLLSRVFTAPFRFFSSLFTTVFAQTFPQSNIIKAVITDPQGQTDTLIPIVTENEGKASIRIPKPERAFRPGKYRLHVEILSEDKGKVFVSQKDFTWGVLAINTNKASYLPGEEAYLQIAALTDSGDTLCNAPLTLSLYGPRHNVQTFSTEEGTIQYSGKCRGNNITNVPDYFAYYKTAGAGMYVMKLRNLANDYEITDFFEVKESLPFEIERIGPTRIYPPASYEMKFIIKANEDFTGEIQERVPESFEITRETKTSWNVEWKKGETYELSYIFDAPDMSPEFYLLGPARMVSSSKNAGWLFNLRVEEVFRESRSWQIASDATSKGLLVYGEDTQITPRYRAWDGSDFGAESSTIEGESGHGDSQFMDIEAAPTRDEKILVEQTSSGHIRAMVWNGSSWGLGGNAPTNGDVVTSVYTSTGRAYAIAYEGLSGDALLIYENLSATSNRTFAYRIWDGTSWSNETSVDYDTAGTCQAGSPIDGRIGSMKAKGQTNGNDILLYIHDNVNSDAFVLVWNGTSNAFGSCDNFSDNNDATTVDIAWETTSKDAMIVYSPTSVYSYKAFSGGSWSAQGTVVDMGNASQSMELASDLSSDYIAFIGGDLQTSNDLEIRMWNGSDWTSVSVPSAESSIEIINAKRIAVAWEANSDQALFIFVDSDGTSVDYFIYDRSDNAFTCPENGQSVTALGNAEGSNGPCNASNIKTWKDDVGPIRLAADPASDDMILMAANDVTLDIQLEVIKWDGTNNQFTAPTTTLIEADTSPGTFTTPQAHAFAFAFDIPASNPSYTQSAYRFFANADSADVGSALEAQDASAVAPDQGTPFRLRMLLHIGTAQLSQSGENFKLQFAQRSGTCDTGFVGETYADVGQSASSTAIRFYDNATPADGTVLTANGSDPTHSSDTIVSQTYKEANNFTNSQAIIPIGQDGKWDFSLVDNSAPAATRYCFRVVKSDETILNTYDVIPEIVTATPATFTQSAYRWLANADPATAMKVGSFTKSTSGAPASQTVAHGLGVTPKTLILWTNAKTNESFSANVLYGFGVTDGTTSKSAAVASQDNVTPSNVSRRQADKALTIVQWGETVIAEADLSSWDATNFTLNWTTNDANAYVIHFIAIGGGGVSAKVVGWTMPGATGNKAVTGVGFQPDTVLHVHTGYDFTSAPASSSNLHFGLGAMDENGNQWALDMMSADASNPSDAQRIQLTNRAFFSIDANQNTKKRASFTSMDADGFTLNFTDASTDAGKAFSLALTGVQVKAGNFIKTTASQPVSQSVTGVGFRPWLTFLTSYQSTSSGSPKTNSRLGIGASDGTTEGSSAFHDANSEAPSEADGIDKTSKVFVVTDNSTPAVDAEANLTSMDADGFTLNWTTNDANATEILYLALAPSSADIGSALALQDTEATAPAQGTPFRLRLLLHVDNATTTKNAQTFKLQFAQRSGTCDTSFSGESYADVTNSTTIRFYDNPSLSDTSALTSSGSDPTHSSDAIINQTYEEANNFTNSVVAIRGGEDGLWDFSLVDDNATSATTYCFRAIKSSGTTLDTYSVIPSITTAGVSFTQSAFRFFANANSTDVGSVLAAQDTAATAPAQGTAFRLRILLHVGGSGLSSSGQSFNLQFAQRSGTCDTGFVGETYADVSLSSGAIRFYDNATPTDGIVLTANASDPVHSSDTIVNQTYEEANNFTNSQAAIPAGQDGKWDFSLIDNSSNANTTYCFRIVKSDASVIDTYSVIPQVTTASPTVQFSLTSSSGSEAATSVNLGLSLSSVSSLDVTVQYALTGGTATGGGVDYTLANGTATISAGSTTANIALTVVDDTSNESDETVEVTLSSPSNATLGANTVHTYTITDNDAASSPSDTTAPVITAVSSQPSAAGATITWTTNESASSQVEYGTTNAYGSQTTESDTSPRVTSHSVFVSGLSSCTTYHYRVKSKDASGNEGVSLDNTVKTAGCGGGGVNPETFAAPQLPLRILINGGNQVTPSRFVTLTFNAGANVDRMSVSNFSDFTDAVIESYTKVKAWTLTEGEGVKNVYARFYTKDYGQVSQVYAAGIVYQVAPVLQQKEKPPVISKPLSEPKPFIDRATELIAPFLPEFLKPKQPGVIPPEPLEKILPPETPLVFQGKWELLPANQIREFVFEPLPKRITTLARKFPRIDETFTRIGIERAVDLPKLKNTKITLSGLTKFRQLPSEVVFVRTGQGTIDVPAVVTFTGKGLPEQKISTIAGRSLTLTIKLDNPAKEVRGFVLASPLTNQRPQGILHSFLFSSLFSPLSSFAQGNNNQQINDHLVLLEFAYTDPDGDGTYTANIQTPAVAGEYEILTIIEYRDPDAGTQALRLITVIDPEGYVYSLTSRGEEVRVKNATVSLSWLNPETKIYELWPAKKFSQENPQITDVTGNYSFLVPEGQYYLAIETPDYLPYKGTPFTIMQGRGVHANIELQPRYTWVRSFDAKTISLFLAFLLIISILGYHFYRDSLRDRVAKSS